MTILADVQEMLRLLQEDKAYGPYIIYVPGYEDGQPVTTLLDIYRRLLRLCERRPDGFGFYRPSTAKLRRALRDPRATRVDRCRLYAVLLYRRRTR